KPVAEKGHVGTKTLIGRNGEMLLRIHRVVNRDAAPGTKATVLTHHRFTASIGEDDVVTRNQVQEGIVGVACHSLKRGRSVDVPEADNVVTPLELEDFALQ